MSHMEKVRQFRAQHRLNWLRRHIPHSYWLAFDAVMALLCLYGLFEIGWVYAIGLALLVLSVLIDVAEFVLKKQGAR